jgi:hypothetical protein
VPVVSITRGITDSEGPAGLCLCNVNSRAVHRVSESQLTRKMYLQLRMPLSEAFLECLVNVSLGTFKNCHRTFLIGTIASAY